MKRFLTLLLLTTAFVAASAQNDEARLLRFPATNGTDVVFSYAGDLWTVPIQGGQARRLTSHIGYEMFARYSPDGKTIAFTGEYDGNREVYSIPATGGEPLRLTYTATNPRDDLGDRMGPNNIVMTWSPDGKQIVFRNRTEDGFAGQLWTISPGGGMPAQIPLPEGGWCSYSPDGKKMAYNRVMREFRTWKYYRGGMADDVWIYDPKAKKVTNISINDAQDIFPMWIGDEIFYASDRDMVMNLFVYNTRSGQTEKVTNFKEYDVKFPSTDGKTIVFENGGWLYKLDPKTRACTKIPVMLGADDIYGRAERKQLSGQVRQASLAPDGSRVVVTARGEVFDVPVGKGVTRNLTRSSNSNDRDASWSPDGKWIAWIGDATGETELYLYDIAKGESKQLTSGADTYIRGIQWAPDSKHIYFTDRKNRFVEVDPLTGAKRTVMECPEAEFRGVDISPDSKWIAYTRPAANEMGIVYLRSLESGKEYPVTDRWYNSGSPTFSTDGKYLIFTSDRDMNPQYSRIEWNYSFTDMSGTYLALLAADTPSPLIAKDPEVKAGEEKADKKDAPKKEDKAAVKVDPEGIGERIIKLPVKGRNFYCDGKSLWYGGRGGTRVYTFASGEDESCCEGMMDVTPGAKKALVMKGRDLYAVNIGPKMALKEKINLKDMVTTVDYSQEWSQFYDEVWRAFRDGYYLENMHGRDWNAIKAKYAQLLPYAKTRLDVNYILGEMISETASGHCYVTPGAYPKPERIPIGLLGARFSKVKDGFRIDQILEGATYRPELRSPLTEPGLGVKEGDVITAIDGVSLKDVDNLYKLLIGKVDVLTELTVNGKKVVVKPIADEGPLEHYAWVMKNIRTVEKLSGGRVGYIYIPDMGPEGLSEWARYYYPQLDKEALIVDDRANGGGNISPMIIERLQRKVYRMTMRRGSSLTGTVPEGTHTGPKVLLINKYSASDGDLFPWSFKANNLGTVIGTRTWGGIVGISGPLPYVDGTDVRVPFFTNYDAATGQWIVENHGVDPDIVLDNDPIKEFAGTDEQLEKAVQVALEQLKDRKPLPGVPAPRTFKDLGLPEIW
ncbi:MAG: PD40 domain-containing protein [Bacteroidales bacterium]|nr:PD40 domain-containing protein [Bacteroidales bacterium]